MLFWFWLKEFWSFIEYQSEQHLHFIVRVLVFPPALNENQFFVNMLIVCREMHIATE